ncbi:YVTN repeat-like/Quino protein amine dehydrogenase [Rozella allomycis CSF55]|uniref:Quinonprotein alcohol dehydrogenase-like superfamily domain-containing protein n=1 Tax=Rozella allomycis (strain CSF55) TaxID=988480 RepID=A0A075APJ1_ROZAC|nr:Quinonprotein alcohol dehydrogenase-like superfamily domain-containing protein [Rozella allomycis CSF55]RKP22019.1 YVTN repeat-like/Quino protein amine dehydrogenase [Rozella allomycis CSF55]|eukprot:EPZ31978.1 Quinonprotein alcohol dehydrogenase-like superfamily domain-containing protein [Rozella allomycis CSF55]
MMEFEKSFLIAPSPSPIRGTSFKLETDRLGENIIYANGKAIYFRNLEHPEYCKEYKEHNSATTVARISPSGYYAASGGKNRHVANKDVNGNVRVWDLTNDSHLLKYETKVISGRINDISWDSESKRIIAVGDGKNGYGKAFMFDSGSSVGEVSGHNKVINAVSIRQQRPFKAVTCSDDYTVNFYNGVPFKFALSITDHSRFVHDVKFNNNGSQFASVGADGKIFLYDGMTGERISELSKCENGHNGGIYGFSWSPDDKKIVTSSGDATCKIWDVERGVVLNTICFDESIDFGNQQVGNAWNPKFINSVSLSGNINYLDERSIKPVKIICGHSKAITTSAKWNDDLSSGHIVKGESKTQISVMKAHEKNTIKILTLDEKLKKLDVSLNSLISNAELEFAGVPVGLGYFKENTFLATNSYFYVLNNDEVTFKKKLDFEPSVFENFDNLIALSSKNEVYLFQFNSNALIENGKFTKNRGDVTCMAFSNDGSLLAVGDSQRAILVYNIKTFEVKINQWIFHNARVNSINWSPDDLFATSGSLDTNIIVWSVEKPLQRLVIKGRVFDFHSLGAHQDGVSNAIFLNNNTILSTKPYVRVRMVAFAPGQLKQHNKATTVLIFNLFFRL